MQKDACSSVQIVCSDLIDGLISMFNNKMIPILTTPAGSCLTANNWQEAGVQCVSYYLSCLLIKPGLAYLKTLPEWKHYSGWDGDWVLNASMPAPNAKGQYVFRSPFDGAKVLCSTEDIVEVILHLKPQQIILSEGFDVTSDEDWHQLSTITRLFVPAQEQGRYLNRPIHGLYYNIENTQDIATMIGKHQANHPDLDYYVACRATQSSEANIESDQPAKDACSGIVYCSDGKIDLREKIYATQFERIDSACDCTTCEQQFTRAYLHHVLEHTPLLCQRFLIQHNIKFFRNDAP